MRLSVRIDQRSADAAGWPSVSALPAVSVADGQLDRGVLGVEVQPVDPQQRLAGLAAQLPGGERGGTGRAHALLDFGRTFVRKWPYKSFGEEVT